MTWQTNLFNNLLVVSILLALGLMIYCKIAGTTLKELIVQIREALAEPIEQ